MAEEVKTGNPTVKYLFVAIFGIIAIILVTGISFFVAKMVYKTEAKIDTSNFKVPIKQKMQLAEFLVPTEDNGGIIKVTIQLGLSTPEVGEVINEKLGMVRDAINKILVSKNAAEAINDYQTGKLHEEIRLQLNELLLEDLGGGVFDGEVKEIVAVYFLNFLVQ